MIGSGPFTVSAISPTEGVEFDSNDDYFKPPMSQHYRSRYFAEDQGPFGAMQAREILSDAGYRWDDQGRPHCPEGHEPQVHDDG